MFDVQRGASASPRRGVRRRLQAAFAAGCLVLASLALAPSEAVAKNTVSTCSISTTGLTFNNYDLLGQGQDASTGTLVLQCTGAGTNTITVGLTTGSGSCATRTLKSGSNALNYNIYTTAALSTVWCDPTTRVSISITFPSNGQPVPATTPTNITLYGAVAAGQIQPSGTYTDTLQATAYWNNAAVSTAVSVPIQVTAPTACSVSVNPLAFGTYSGAATQSQSTVTAACSLGASYTVALGGGANLSGVQRRMSDGAGHYIPYFLFSDAARASAWGDGTALGATVPGTGTGSGAAYPVYGSTGAQPATPPGAYADSVIVTVTY